MRRWLRIAVLLLLPAGILAAVLGWTARRQWARQWASYRIGTASTFEEARARIAALEAGPDCDARLRELVRRWGSGNRQFDLYLARYVDDPGSSASIRKAFSLELAWREPLLARWAHYWCFRAPQEPDAEIASLVDYFYLLVSAEPARSITWREVLDLQAVLQVCGSPEAARRLSPENWQTRYRRWQATRQEPLPHVARPRGPFADLDAPKRRAAEPRIPNG